MKASTLLLILAVSVACLALAYRAGLDKGAETMAVLASQNNATDSLAQVRNSVRALAAQDLAASQREHFGNLAAALFRLGHYMDQAPYLRCSRDDAAALSAAADYLDRYPKTPDLKAQGGIGKALAFCEGSIDAPSAN
jgi:hypothetical protein